MAAFLTPFRLRCINTVKKKRAMSLCQDSSHGIHNVKPRQLVFLHYILLSDFGR